MRGSALAIAGEDGNGPVVTSGFLIQKPTMFAASFSLLSFSQFCRLEDRRNIAVKNDLFRFMS